MVATFYMHIFVGSDEPPETFARAVAAALGVKLEPVPDNALVLYQYAGATTWFDIGRHDFKNDHELNFEDYAYAISVGAYKAAHRRYKVTRDFARAIFDKLKATQRYRLMLVEDLELKIAEYDPATGP